MSVAVRNSERTIHEKERFGNCLVSLTISYRYLERSLGLVCCSMNKVSTPQRAFQYLFEIEVEIMSVAVLEHSAERVAVDLEHVVELHDARVVQRLVDVVLPERVPANTRHTL